MWGFSRKKNIPKLCGGSSWSKGLTSKFEYYAVNGVQLNVEIIKELCKCNMDRKYYGVRSIPFIKDVKNEEAIHISFLQVVTKDNRNSVGKMCDEALSDLLSYMREIGVNCKWKECSTKKQNLFLRIKKRELMKNERNREK